MKLSGTVGWQLFLLRSLASTLGSFHLVGVYLSSRLPQRQSPLLCRGNLFTPRRESNVWRLCCAYLEYLYGPFLLGFSAAPLCGSQQCVCCLSFSLCLLFFLTSFPPFPALGDLSFVSFGSSCPWPFLWGSGQVGPLPVLLLALLALCSF